MSVDPTDDSALFESLVARHQDRLYRVAYRMAGSHDEAQDLLQDALVEAYQAFHHFRRGTYFDKWIYKIMSHTFIDGTRVKKRLRFESLDDPVAGDETGSAREIPDSESDPSVRMMREELAEPVQDALNALPPEFRLILILADVEEMSYEEISEMIGCPIGTVRSRLHRARAQMRACLIKSKYRDFN